MPCGCQSGATGEQWVVVFADSTQSNAMTKSEATQLSNQSGGSWIKELAAATK